MKLNHTDVLKIIWGDGTKTARPANGWDGLPKNQAQERQDDKREVRKGQRITFIRSI